MSEMRIRILHAVPSCGHDSERALRVTAGQRMRPTRTEPTYFMRKGRAEPHLPQQAARPTDATDGIDQRRRRQCACLPRSHAKALTGKKNAQTPASMPANPLAPSIFGGQKRCIQQSPPRMLGAIQPLSSRRSAQVFTHCDTNQGRNRHRRKTSPKRSFSRVCHPRAAASGSAGISTDR